MKRHLTHGLVAFAAIAALSAPVIGQDCNNNNVPDATDIADGTSLDDNLNGIPDECERCDAPEDEKVTASDAAARDRFGWSVDLDTDLAVIGAPFVGNDDAGAVYVYRHVNGTWSEEARLVSPNPAAFEQFGEAVAVSGNVIVVGAPANGDLGDDSGVVYIFEYDGQDWSFSAAFSGPDTDADDRFGHAVDADDDHVLVGAPGHQGAGSAYVFRNDAGSGWLFEAKVQSSDLAASDDFGHSVALDDDGALVGAPLHNADGLGNSGAAYVFRSDNGLWSQESKLTAPTPAGNDEFGRAVSLVADLAVAGAPENDVRGSNAGAAFVFRRDTSGTWGHEASLLAFDGAFGDRFGVAVASNGETIVIAASGDDDGGTNAGALYVLRQSGSRWFSNAKLVVSDSANTDEFGAPLAMGDEVVLAGSPQDDDDGFNSGAAYLFQSITDCNQNGLLDTCDLLAGTSTDINDNNRVDECDPDCNLNQIPDDVDLSNGTSSDCNGNDVPDECDIADTTSSDCDGNGTPDECDLAAGGPDCDGNGVLDACDIAAGVADCDNNGVPDTCEPDGDADGVIDACDQCPQTPPDTVVDADGCSATPTAPLTVRGACTDEPELLRNWVVTNPNDFDVALDWRVLDSKVGGAHVAPPGESQFASETVPDSKNRIEISWLDGNGNPQSTDAESSVEPCTLLEDADSDGVADEDDWCPETKPERSVDEHGCAKGQKVAMCKVKKAGKRNRREKRETIHVRPHRVDHQLAKGATLGACDSDDTGTDDPGDDEPGDDDPGDVPTLPPACGTGTAAAFPLLMLSLASGRLLRNTRARRRAR